LASSLIPEFTGDETSALYDELYLGYLPGSFRDRFPEEVLQRHPLRREIIATVLTNRLINHAGCAFFFNLQSSSGCDLTTLVEGYLALEASLELPTLRTQLLEAPVSEAVRYEAFLAVEQTLGSLLENLVQTNSAPTLSKVQTLGELFKELCSLRGDHPESLEKWEKAGFTPELAQTLSGFEQLRSAPAVLQLLQETEMPIAQAQECVRGLNSLLQLDWLEQALEQLSLTNQWEQLQQGLLLQSIQAQQLRLLRLLHHSVHSSNIPFSREALPVKNVEEPVRESLEQINRKALGAYLEVIEQFQQAGTPDLIMLTVAVQRIQAIS
jgi:glutamate dehydrogenase